jgi:hypothetical protein
MLSIGLWRWYINLTVTIVDIIHGPVFYFKHNVLETGICLQVESNRLDPIDRPGDREVYLLGETE